MQIDLPENLQRAGPNDWKRLGDITAEAFADDPINRWIFGNPRALKTVFTVLARAVYTKHGFCYLAGDNGAAMWSQNALPFKAGWFDMMAFGLGLARYGSKGAMKRAMAAGEIMAKHHPTEPHMYLFTIGTRKNARGKGLGKALLAPVLTACDRDGVACYLENSNPDNHGFYRAHGFETREHFTIGDGSPQMEAMWRAPKS